MSQNKTKKTKITIICWNCDRKFSVLLDEVEKERVVYLGEDDAELSSRLISAKTYLVPCPDPDCKAENEVRVP